MKKVKSNYELFERSILMKANEGKLNKSLGFTIVELLTVMGVIAILIGLLVPALSLVKDYSKEIQQKAQFHSIEVGLGMYKTEFGKYPPSRDNLSAYNPPDLPPAPLDDYAWAYGGANKLAEAMVGLDMLGFHPSSIFRADGRNTRDESNPGELQNLMPYQVYHAGDDDLPWGETAKENVDNRKGPYIELENANAFKIEDVYNDLEQSTSAFGEPTESVDTLVLCDVYAERRAHSGKKTGMPILYYRARVQYTYQEYDPEYDPEGIDIENDIYYYPDNQNLLELGLPEDQDIDHPLSDRDENDEVHWLRFENMIRNTQVTSVNRPYCADSYILISAGKDGMYGTADDIFNFNKEQN
jgi:type II secretory pathway pseudopilin PulG